MTPTDPELWRRADAIFQEALDRAPAERDAFVTAACAGDAALGAIVRELLAADARAGALLDEPVEMLAAAAAAEYDAADGAASGGTGTDVMDSWIGRAIGRFRIVRRLGKGGMGIVYEAEQDEPRRRVALKLMRGGWSADALELRFFRREAQTLARLQHPGIAAIYEVGATDDDQPFFAMELVRGVPLDTPSAVVSSDDLRNRLDLFLEVCDAIVYAHQRGVIHRDLKPSNILVTEDALRAPASRGAESSVTTASRAHRVKVVDFGLAQISGADVSMVASRTEPSALQGTLPYMSPEQTLGPAEEIDFRSDVYSLGIILYRLLAGAPPYVVRADALLDAVRIIREETPRKAGAVAPLLRGDVETILAKALEKDPDRRYQNVAALADDIRRFLTNQPILARPASAAYQLRKLAARHRAAATLLGTLAGVLVAATTSLLLLYDAQRRERTKAVAEAAKATAVSDFLVRMMTSVDPEFAVGVDVTVHEVLDAAARDVASHLRASPEVASALQLAVGQAYVSLGLYDAALPQLTASLDTRRTLFGEEHPEYAAGLAGLAQHYVKTGRMVEGESLLTRALGIRRRTLGDSDPKVAEALQYLAAGALERGDYARAESLHRAAIRIWEAAGPDSPDALAGTINLALNVQGQARYSEAESLYHNALDRAARLYGDSHPQYAQALNNLGLLLTEQRRLAEADSVLRRALAIRLAAFGPDHPEVAITRNNLARALRFMDRCEESIELYQQAIAAFEKRLGPAHQYTNATRNNLALCYELLGQSDLAVSMLEDAIEKLRAALGEDHPMLVKSYNNLGVTLLRRGAISEAEAVFHRGLESQRRLAPDHPDYAMTGQNLVAVLRVQNRFEEAEALAVTCFDIRRRLLGAEHMDTANSELRLGELRLERGRLAEADSFLSHALATQAATAPATHPRVALAQNALGACRLAQGRRAEAESLLVPSSEVLLSSPMIFEADRRAVRARLAALRATPST